MALLQDFIIEETKPVKEALHVINKNGCGVCFVVSSKKLKGVITDGDLRRYLLKESNLDCRIKNVMNKKFIYFHVQTDSSTIRERFSDDIKFIPLVDDEFNLVDVASAKKMHMIPVLEPDLSGNEMAYVNECIRTNWISSQGKFVKQFESQFSKLHLGRHAVSVTSGTTALHLALKTLNIGIGDEVIIPNITFAACANAVILSGATPVFCEIDAQTWCISPSEIQSLLTNRTKAIMIVHLYGQVADIDAIIKIADQYDLFILEDCAEALGSKYKDQPVGTFGNIGTFSFFGNKTISTGEGGMLIFEDEKLAKKSRILRDHGMDPNNKYWHEYTGYNYRLTNLQAAVGLAQLERFKNIVDKKIAISNWYKIELSKFKWIAQEPSNIDMVLNSNWLFTIVLADDINKDKLIKKLLERGIETRRVFYPLHQMPPFKTYNSSKNLLESERLSKNGISLPSSVNLQRNDIIYIVKVIDEVIRNLMN